MNGFKTVTFALLVSASLGYGQVTSSQPRQPGSIAPGTVNYVEGQVSLDGQSVAAAASVAMQPGQTLATGNGFAEVLLTPGTFLRVGHDSQIHLVTSGLADTKAELDRGVAIVEVDQFIKGTNLAISLDGATAQVEKKGLYDFDAGQKAVRVLDGKANVVTAAGSKTIGKDDQLLLASEKPLKTSSFDAKAIKSQILYVWSEARSQDESQANVALAQNIAAYGGWYGPGWYWDPYWSFYAYLPADGLLYSPFGWGFYSPAFVGYYGVPFGYYGHFHHYGWHGHVPGVHASVNGFHGGFHNGPVTNFHGGLAGGGFHGGARR